MVRMRICVRKEWKWSPGVALATLMLLGCDMHKPWPGPRTEAEASGYQRTSSSSQVGDFIAACAAHSPILTPLTIGESTRKMPLHLVLAADPPVATIGEARKDGRPKVLVMANIHAGEVEGKEAVLAFLREIAQGGHQDIVKKVIVAFVPNYNPDGNDEFDRRNRPDQAGPVEGVGVRHNGSHLDLNRDYVKVEAPETEALIRTVRALDAMLVVDLHTTDGSFHGFDLTYAGPLHPATDPGILDFERMVFLPELQRKMRSQGFETFDYGNWVEDDRPASGWASFEARPRFGNSYFGLRNRLTLLSEAYSHDPFEKRIRSTHALIEEGLRLVAEKEAAIRTLMAEADKNATHLTEVPNLVLPVTAKLARTEASRPIPVGGVREEKDPVTGLVRQWDNDVSTPVPMPVFAWFEGDSYATVPKGWIVRRPTEKLRRVLEIHGIESVVLDREKSAVVESIRIDSVKPEKQAFQGHNLKAFQLGRSEMSAQPEAIPAGALYVSVTQPLARLAFVLFEPGSDDGLGTWDLLGVEPDPGHAGAERSEALHFLSWAPR